LALRSMVSSSLLGLLFRSCDFVFLSVLPVFAWLLLALRLIVSSSLGLLFRSFLVTSPLSCSALTAPLC